MNIYVSNLSFNVQDDDLRGFFESYGEVASAKVIMDKFTNKSRGFGFVEMPNDDQAQTALDTLNGSTLDKRQISVTEARPKPQNDRYSNDRPQRNRY